MYTKRKKASVVNNKIKVGGPQWSRTVPSASINKTAQVLQWLYTCSLYLELDSCTYKNCEIAIATTTAGDEAACVIDTPIMVASVNGGGTVLKNYPVNRDTTGT